MELGSRAVEEAATSSVSSLMGCRLGPASYDSGGAVTRWGLAGEEPPTMVRLVLTAKGMVRKGGMRW